MKSMLEEAWTHFYEKAKSKGLGLPAEAKAMVQDFFMAGYCYGYNDLLCTIKQQLDAEEAANDLIEGQ